MTQLALNIFPPLSYHTHRATHLQLSQYHKTHNLHKPQYNQPCALYWHRGLPAGCPRGHYATTKRAARHQVQPGPTVPADFWRGIYPLPQHFRQRWLQPAVVSRRRDSAVLHQERQPALGRRYPMWPQQDLPQWRVQVHPGCDAATGKKKN